MWIPDVVKGVLLSLIAYLAVFAYEVGYCGWFGIPIDLIRLDSTRFVAYAAAIWVFLFLVLSCARLLFELVRDLFARGHRSVTLFFLWPGILLVLSLLIYMISGNWRSLLIAIAILIVLMGLEIWGVAEKRGSTFREKVELYASERGFGLDNYFAKRFGVGSWYFLVGVMYLLLVSHETGVGEARRQERFLCISSEPPKLVLRVYGDRMICASFDEATRRTEKAFTLVDLSKGFDERLSLRAIGPLRPKD